MLYYTKLDMVRGIIKGLALPLHSASKQLIATRTFSLQVMDYSRTIERECHQTIKVAIRGHISSSLLVIFLSKVGILLVNVNNTKILSG